MILFRDKGYDATSIADIAKAMNVVPGLCYRYFTNKKEIFDAAVKQYAMECCDDFIMALKDYSKSFAERLDSFGLLMINKEDHSRHRDFYHAPGNETFHFQLGLEMFKYLTPHLAKELKRLNDAGEIRADNPELLAQFLLYGQTPLWLSPDVDPHSKEFIKKLEEIKNYILKLTAV